MILVLVTEVAAELFPSGNSESNRCLTLQLNHSVLSSFALFPSRNHVFQPLLPNLGPWLWLHSSEAFWVFGVKLLVFSKNRQRRSRFQQSDSLTKYSLKFSTFLTTRPLLSTIIFEYIKYMDTHCFCKFQDSRSFKSRMFFRVPTLVNQWICMIFFPINL